jgi:Ca2+-binding EF-hand superfamily protein
MASIHHLGGYQSAATKANIVTSSALSDAEFRTLLTKAFRELNIRFSSVGAGLRTLHVDQRGQLPRKEVQKLFEYCGIKPRVADRIFNHVRVGDSESIPAEMLRELLDPEVGSVASSRRSSYDQASPEPVPNIEDTVHLGNNSKTNKMVNEIMVNLEKLGIAAFRRHGNMEKAFRAVDTSRSGWVTRKEIHSFYRLYGFEAKQADAFFDIMDTDKSGGISYKQFIQAFKPYFHEEEYLDKQFRIHTCRPTDVPQYGSENRKLELPNDLRIIISNIGKILAQKHNTMHSAFRRIDGNCDGTIMRDEVRKFFRNNGYPSNAVADEFFDYLDADGSGLIHYREFQSYFGPFLWVSGEPGQPTDPYEGLSSYQGGYGHSNLKFAYDVNA